MATRSKPSDRIFATVSLLALAAILAFFFLTDRKRDRDTTIPRIAANLKGLATACLMYAGDNDNHLPPHPAYLVITGQLSPAQFSFPGDNPMPLPHPLPDPDNWRDYVDQFDQHSAFFYLGADLPSGMASSDSDIIFAYTKKSPLLPNGRLVGFGDGRVQFIPETDLPKIFAQSNAARARLNLPPIPLDTQPPIPK